MKKLVDCLKIGDKVFDILNGWGVVKALDRTNTSDFSIEVQFDKDWYIEYTGEGKMYRHQLQPSLFLEEIKLEQRLPEFVEGEIVLFSDFENVNNLYAVGRIISYDKNRGYTLIPLNFFGYDTFEVATFNVKSFNKSHFE